MAAAAGCGRCSSSSSRERGSGYRCTDRTTQKSSILSPIFGKISLTSSPFCPYFFQVNGERIRLPVENSVLGTS
jgi:hypothetical protein